MLLMNKITSDLVDKVECYGVDTVWLYKNVYTLRKY